jgi:hypothetical protein
VYTAHNTPPPPPKAQTTLAITIYHSKFTTVIETPIFSSTQLYGCELNNSWVLVCTSALGVLFVGECFEHFPENEMMEVTQEAL